MLLQRFQQLLGHAKNIFNILFGILKAVSTYLGYGIKILLTFLWQRTSTLLYNVGDDTGILALKLMFCRHLHAFERFFWFVTFIGGIYGAHFITRIQIVRYFKSPTVISVDRNYRDWVGYVPAVTLCYHDHIDSLKANEYILEHWNVSIVDEDYFYFMDFLSAVVNASASNYVDLAKYAEDERFDDVDLYEIIQTIDRPFEQIINTFEANFEVSVRTAMTERGFCYIINSAIGVVLGDNFRFSFQTFEELKSPLKCNFGKQQCYIKIDLLESTGVVEVHSPFEIASTDGSVIALQKSDEIIASYKVLETVASSNLHDLSVDQRKCVFNDEETAGLRIYSKTLCLARCRAMMALEMCNCVPFFYNFVDGPSCSPPGFECLMDFKWPIWALHICKCPNTCIEMDYTVQTVKKSSWGASNMEETYKSDVVTSSFRWDLIPPKVRLRRDVVFSFEDLLVSFGGTLALFLGFSILSLMLMGYTFGKQILEDILCMFGLLWQGIMVIRNKFYQRKREKKALIVKGSKVFNCLQRVKQCRKKNKLIKIHLKTSKEFIDVTAKGEEKKLAIEQSHSSSVFEFVN